MICHVWFVTFVCPERYSGGSEFLIIGEQLHTGQTVDENRRPRRVRLPSCCRWFRPLPEREMMPDGLDRLKVLINSSTPIVVMETSEEMRAVSLVRAACSELNMATFEWSIADGLVRSGSNAPAENHRNPSAPRAEQPGGWTRVS